MKKLLRSITGYSLLELSIVLTVISIVGISILTLTVDKHNIAKEEITIEQMQHLEEAIVAYYHQYGHLPCPADSTVADNGTGFGLAGASTLLGQALMCPNVINNLAHTAGNVVANIASKGAVPVYDLSLPISAMYDGWGRRITYIVTNELTDIVSAAGASDGMLGLLTSYTSAAPDITGAAFVLISHGQKGHGAWLRSGIRANNLTNNPLRDLLNADGISTYAGGERFTSLSLLMSKNYSDPSDKENSIYDDIVRYKMLWQIKKEKARYFYNSGSRCDYGMFMTPSVLLMNSTFSMHINNVNTYSPIAGITDIRNAIINDITPNTNIMQRHVFVRDVYCKRQQGANSEMMTCFYDKDCVCSIANNAISSSTTNVVANGYLRCVALNYWTGTNAGISYQDSSNTIVTLGDQNITQNLICFDNVENC